jgi:CRISPR/Cas system-associated endonuclease Cas1
MNGGYSQAAISGRRQGRLGELASKFTARNAIHPIQATRAIAARGLDAAFGFLHDGRKPGRLRLVWDCAELHRPMLVRETFGYASAREFRKTDFRMLESGIVRLAPHVAADVAALTIKTITLRDMMKTVEWMANQIRRVTNG